MCSCYKHLKTFEIWETEPSSRWISRIKGQSCSSYSVGLGWLGIGSDQISRERGGGGVALQSFVWGCSILRSNPLLFCMSFWQKGTPWCNLYWKTSSNVNQKSRYIYSVPAHIISKKQISRLNHTTVYMHIVPQLVKSLALHIPESWKRSPFWTEPFHIPM